MSVLVVAEHLRGQVRDVTFELIAAGRELGGPLAVAVIGADPGALNVMLVGLISYTEIVPAVSMPFPMIAFLLSTHFPASQLLMKFNSQSPDPPSQV